MDTVYNAERFKKVAEEFISRNANAWDVNFPEGVDVVFDDMPAEHRAALSLFETDEKYTNDGSLILDKNDAKFWKETFGLDIKAITKQAKDAVKEQDKAAKKAEEQAPPEEPAEPEPKTKGKARNSKLKKDSMKL